MNSAHRPRWAFQTKLVVSLLILAFFIYLLFRFSEILPPFILAVIVAYVLAPLAETYQRRLRLPRLAGIGLAYLTALLMVAALPSVLIPLLANEFEGAQLDIQTFTQTILDFLDNVWHIGGYTINMQDLVEQINTGLQGLVEPFIGQTLGLLINVFTSIIWVIFIVVVSFYLIKDSAGLRAWFEHLVPPDYMQDYLQLRDQINQIWSAFFRGQIALAMVVTGIFAVAGLILGLPFALGLAILAGLLEFLPSIGHGIWLSLAVILCLIQGSTWLPLPAWVFTLIVVGLHLVFQQFDLNYLIPRIIGRSVHLPPLVVILGIVAGAVLAGILGIPLAAPTIASARVIGRYIYANIFDMEPFPAQEQLPLLSARSDWWKPSSVNIPKSTKDKPA